MEKAELQKQAFELIEQLPTEELQVFVDLLTDFQNRQAQDTAHTVEADAEIALKEIMKDYERAWKTLAKM